MDLDKKMDCPSNNLNQYKKPRLKKAYIAIGAFSVTVILITMLVLPIYEDKRGIDILLSTLRGEVKETVDVGEESFSNTEDLGWELLDNNKVLHIWNQHNDYYFNVNNGIQFSNHYLEYWTKNVLMFGYYDGDEWNLIYRTDELSGFTKNITGETDDYINATLWKDLSYASYDFRLAIRYHLGVNDSDLTIIPYIKNLGVVIPYVLGFGWEMKDIRIANVINDNYLQIYNGTDFERILLNQTLDRNFTDMDLNTSIKFICTNPPSPFLSRNLYLSWDENLTYMVICKSRDDQYNAPTTLFIRVGTLAVGQEKFTKMYWLDADDWLGISSAEYDDSCGASGVGFEVTDALDGTSYWYHPTDEVHWFVLDLGQTYTIKKLKGRSLSPDDPRDINIYIDDSNPPTTLIEEGITTWVNTLNWVEIDITDSDGRYIKVEIEDTEDPNNNIIFGHSSPAWMTIFDAYGDVATNFSGYSQDGYIYRADEVTYAGAHDANTGTADAGSWTRIGQGYSAKTDYFIYRGFVFFNTSIINATDTINSCKLHFYLVTDISATDFDIVIQSGQPTYPHDPLVTGDYDKDHYSGDGGYISTTGMSDSNWYNISFNSTALGWINRSGMTKLCLRSREDINNNAPTTVDYVILSGGETGNSPYLEIDYEALAPENNPPEISPTGNETPTNNSYVFDLNPTCEVYIEDNDSDQTTCDWYTSTDGSSWTHQQTNTSVLNETIYYDYTTSWNDTYYWKVTANDTHDNVSKWFNFTMNGYFPYCALYGNGTDPDGTLDTYDTGTFTQNLPRDHPPTGNATPTVEYRCGAFYNLYINETYTPALNTTAGFKINTIYIHQCMVDNTDGGEFYSSPASWEYGYNITGTTPGGSLEYTMMYSNESPVTVLASNIDPDSDTFNLSTVFWDCNESLASFDSVADIALYTTPSTGFKQQSIDAGVHGISNRSIMSFIIINVPSDIWDGTDNSTDSDGDGLSDHMELNTTYGYSTNPFLSDTDNDGINDYWEIQAGSDPNNYTETFNVTTWQNVDTTYNGAFTNTTVWYNVDISINGEFTNTTTWQNVNTSINGEFTNTTNWQNVDITYNGEFTNVTTWQNVDIDYNGEFTNISIKTWQVVNDTINGVFTNTTLWYNVDTTYDGSFTNATTWQNVDTSINGEFTNTTIWQDVDTSINGAFTNISIRTWQTVNDTINGIFTNTTTWKDVDTSINGVFINGTTWQNVDTTYNGAFTNTTVWQVVNDTINGEFTNVSIKTWQVVNDTINGAFTNATLWRVVNDTINGVFTNATSWKDVDTIYNGEFTNTTAWYNVDITYNGEFTNVSTKTWQNVNTSINGEFTNVSTKTWQVVNDTLNGAFTNTTTWQDVNTSINGIFTNTTLWYNVDITYNGEFTNTTVWRDVDTSINGVFTNISIRTWQIVNNTLNGVFTNTTTWHDVDITYNGEFTNTTIWKDVDTSINGAFTNGTTWYNIDTSINGEFTNTSIRTWQNVDTTYNGEFTNVSVKIWQVVNNTVNGVFTNTTTWRDIDTTYDGSFTNATTWQNVDTSINGEFTNTTIWWNVDISINGEFTNASTKVWQVVDNTFNGIFTNTTVWQNVDVTYNGVFTNTTTWRDVDTSIDGLFTNTTAWQNIDITYNGEFTNISIRVWQNIDVSINGVFTNISIRTWQVVNDTINGIFTNTTVWQNIDTTYNGVFINGTTWQIVDNNINGLFTNVSISIIAISSPSPSNGSTNVQVNTSLHFTVNHASGYTMNISVYTGSNLTNCSALLGSFNSVANGTYYLGYHNASNVSTEYAWKVNVSNGKGNFAQEIYNFTTASTVGIYSIGVGRYTMGMVIVFALLFIMFPSLIMVVLWKRKRNKIKI